MQVDTHADTARQRFSAEQVPSDRSHAWAWRLATAGCRSGGRPHLLSDVRDVPVGRGAVARLLLSAACRPLRQSTCTSSITIRVTHAWCRPRLNARHRGSCRQRSRHTSMLPATGAFAFAIPNEQLCNQQKYTCTPCMRPGMPVRYFSEHGRPKAGSPVERSNSVAVPMPADHHLPSLELSVNNGRHHTLTTVPNNLNPWTGEAHKPKNACRDPDKAVPGCPRYQMRPSAPFSFQWPLDRGRSSNEGGWVSSDWRRS